MIPKFRAWVKEDKEMWPVHAIVFDNKTVWVEEPDDENPSGCLCFDDVILMQSTGLKDKNGKEIFEGDIVQFLDCYLETDFLCSNRGIVKWNQGSFTITNRFSVGMEDLLDGDSLDVKIISNIYENLELLE